MPFAKGQSGNPGGVQKSKEWQEAIRRAVKRRREGKGAPQELDRLADKLVEAGLEGDVAALKEIGDRLDGKPAQPLEHDASAGLIDLLRAVEQRARDGH